MAEHLKMEELLARLEQILQRQDVFVKEIAELKAEIYSLRASPSEQNIKSSVQSNPHTPPVKGPTASTASAIKLPPKPGIKLPWNRSDIERFIGENLINKIGIIITILGVAIGIKYSVENGLISPLFRILLGYLAGLTLLGFGLKFRRNYENYSAVLVSGAIAIMYFITYAGYGFYGIFSQGMAFGLMLIFTFLTVFAALKYNRPVIAHIGMVGAYAIPFLLGDDSGNVVVLFSYMAIINLGILAIAFKRYWKSLFYAVFFFTWLIFLMWIFNDYTAGLETYLAFVFSVVFFTIFYITFLAYKLIHKELYNVGDVVLLLANSFIFFGIGYHIINGIESGEQYLGLFTTANAAIHAMAGILVRDKVSQKSDLYYFIIGLALVFITIAVPVQLDAGWVTLIWAGEAALLFWIGRTRQAPAFEKISYAVMAISFLSLMEDWASYYVITIMNGETSITPIWNTGFLTSLLFIIAFSFITYLFMTKPHTPFNAAFDLLNQLLKYAIPGVLLFSIYYTFRIEIETYWQQRYLLSGLESQSTDLLDMVRNSNPDLRAFKSIWVINYSLLFLGLLSYINMKIFKSRELGIVSFILSIFALLVFLSQGLIAHEELRQSHINQAMTDQYSTGPFHIWIRYISIAVVTLVLIITKKHLQIEFLGARLRVGFELFMHFVILIMVSSELFIWINSVDPGNSFKLALSILWGVYSLLLIGLGIKQNRKYLRVAAIVLFAITLIKLFVYDIAELNTLSKTIVFVCLGVLLLIISFLYNKYKQRISL